MSDGGLRGRAALALDLRSFRMLCALGHLQAAGRRGLPQHRAIPDRGRLRAGVCEQLRSPMPSRLPGPNAHARCVEPPCCRRTGLASRPARAGAQFDAEAIRARRHWGGAFPMLAFCHEHAGTTENDGRRVPGLGRGAGRALGALQRRALSHGARSGRGTARSSSRFRLRLLQGIRKAGLPCHMRPDGATRARLAAMSRMSRMLWSTAGRSCPDDSIEVPEPVIVVEVGLALDAQGRRLAEARPAISA